MHTSDCTDRSRSGVVDLQPASVVYQGRQRSLAVKPLKCASLVMMRHGLHDRDSGTFHSSDIHAVAHPTLASLAAWT